MKPEPKVTVLMPCFNAGIYLKEAVESILNQTYRNLEILLIDDGSSDETKEMITEFAIHDSRIVPIYNEVNIGLIRTLNKGIKVASGTFIARMDADDISALNRIEKIVDAFYLNPEIDVISAGYYHISQEGKILRRNYPKATISKALHYVTFFCTPVLHPCVVVKREVFVENPYDEQFLHSEDYDVFSRMLSLNYKFMNLEEPLYFLRMNRQSVSYKYERIQISTHNKISIRNIDDYFGKVFDYFQHKVMINRFSYNVSVKLLKEVLSANRELRNEFIAKENLSPEVIKQIDEFMVELTIDIYLQSLKFANWLNKPRLFFVMIFDCKFFFSERGKRYMRSKLTFLRQKLD